MSTRQVTGFVLSGRAAVGVLLVAALMAMLCSPGVQAAPQGENVVSGSATFERSGATTTITAGNRAIINYSSFDVAANETVRFVQPGATATVLNRIQSASPTQIDGTLQANGIVYLVNRAGVIFGPGSVVNVGGLYAAAACISNQDFLAGINRFTDSAGEVANNGTIIADAVNLIGRTVANHGSIVAVGGLVTMVAGKDVLLSEEVGGHLMVRLEGSAEQVTGKPGVENTGTIQAPGGKVLLAAGDMFSLAARQAGNIQADVVTVRVQAGTTEVTGDIDATGPTGGKVAVTGRTIVIDGATIDVSGQFGGGEILIGGGYQGKDPSIRNAEYTFVGAGSVLKADATAGGDGGTVVVWADNATAYYGSISARGGLAGGNGGAVEVSGKSLAFRGTVDTRAPAGLTGTLLLDPTDLTIVPGNAYTGVAASLLAWVPSNPLGVGDNVWGAGFAMPMEDAGPMAIGAADLTTLLGAVSLTLEASNILSVTAPVVWASATTLTLTGGAQVVLVPGGNINCAGLGGLTINGGAVVLQAPVVLTGGSFTSSGTTFDNSGGGTITTGGGPVAINNTGAVTVGSAINAGVGTVTVNGGGAGAASIGGAGLITTSSTLTLKTTGAIGSVGTPVSTAGTGTIAASSVTAGDIYINNTGNATLGATSAAGSNVIINNVGSLNITGAVAAGTTGDVQITVTGADQNLTVGNTINAGATSGAVTLIATGNVAVNSAVTTANGAVVITADSEGSGTGTVSVANAVTVTAGGANNMTVTGADVVLTGTGALSAAGDTINLYNSVAASQMFVGTAGAGWSVTAAEVDNLTASAVVFGLSGSQAGAITIDALAPATNTSNLTFNTSGNVGFSNGATTLLANANLTVNSGAAVTVNKNVQLGGTGVLTLNAGIGAPGVLTLSDDVAVSGAAVTLRAHDIAISTTASHTASVTATGAVNIYADAAATTIGLAGGTGTLALSAAELNLISFATALTIGESVVQAGNITLGAFSPPAGWAGNVVLNAAGAGGNVVFGGAWNDVQAGTSLTVNADPITVSANVSQAGNINWNTDAINFTGAFSVTSTGGSINFQPDGGSLAVTLSSGGAHTDTLSALAGTVTVNGTVNSSGANDSLTINSGGTINLQGALGGTSALVNLSLDAGDAGNVNLPAVEAGGAVQITNVNTLTFGGAVGGTAAPTSITASAANVNTGIAINADLKASGNITLGTTAGDIDVTGARTVESTGAAVDMGTVGGTIDLQAVGGGTFTARAGTGVTLATVNDAANANSLSVDAGNTGAGNVVIGNIGATGAPVGVSVDVAGNGTVQFGTVDASGAVQATNTTGVTVTGAIGGATVPTSVSLAGTNISLQAVTTSGGGAQSYSADTIVLGGNLTGDGTLTLQTISAARTIGIGAAATGNFNLDATEIGYLQNGFTLITIGKADSGAVNVTTAAFNDPLAVLCNGAITVNTSLTSDTSMSLTGTTATVAGLTTGSLTVTATADDSGTPSFVHTSGAITATGAVTIQADDMNLTGGTITATGQIVTLRSNTAADQWRIGTGTANNRLDLSETELGTIDVGAAGTVRIGTTAAAIGNISNSSTVNSTKIGTLTLVATTLTDDAALTFTGGKLLLSSAGAITWDQGSHVVGTLAMTTTTSANLTYRGGTGALTVGSADGVNGADSTGGNPAAGGNIEIRCGGDLTLSQLIDGGATGTVTLTTTTTNAKILDGQGDGVAYPGGYNIAGAALVLDTAGAGGDVGTSTEPIETTIPEANWTYSGIDASASIYINDGEYSTGDKVITSALNSYDGSSNYSLNTSGTITMTSGGGGYVRQTGGSSKYIKLTAYEIVLAEDYSAYVDAGNKGYGYLQCTSDGYIELNAGAGGVTISSGLLQTLTGRITINTTDGGVVTIIGGTINTTTTGKITINSSGGVAQSAGTISNGGTGGLELLGSGTFNLASATNSIAKLAASLTGTSSLTMVNAGSFSVDTVNTAGVTVSGAVALTASSGTLTVAATAKTPDVSGTTISLRADEMTLTGTVGAAGQTVTLRPYTAATAINLNNGAAGLDLSTATLGQVKSDTLIVGASDSGAIGIGSDGALNLSAASYGLTLRGGAATFANTLTLGAGKTLTFDGTGAITSSGAADVSISGGSLVFTATGAVGTSGNPLRTAVGNLSGSSSGGVFVTNTGALAINSAGVSAAGGIVIIASSPLTVSSDVIDSGGGDITLTATNDGGNDDHLTINARVLASGGSGNINLNAGTDLVINGTGSAPQISAAGSGIITGIADRNVTMAASVAVQSTTGAVSFTADNAAGNNGGAITMADGAVVDGGSGAVGLSADGAITLGRVVTTNATAAAVSLSSTSGGVVDGGDTGGEDVSAGGRLLISAAAGVGAGGAIETAVGSLSVVNGAAGAVAVRDTDGLSLVGLTQGNAAAATIAAGGALTVDGDVAATAGSAVTLWAGTSGTGNLSFSALRTIAVNTLTLQAGDGVGGVTTATADALTNSPAFLGAAGAGTSPASFTMHQDGSLADTAIPAAAQFGAGTGGMAIALQSDDGGVTVATTGKLNGTALTLTAPDVTNGNITVSVDLTGMVSTNFNAGHDLSAQSVASTGLQSYTAGGTITITGTHNSSAGAVQFNGPVTLASDVAVTGTTATFSDLVDATTAGVQGLAVTGNAVFDGAVGTTALTYVTVSGTTAINGASVATTGIQTYSLAATLGADTTLTGSTITFGNTLDAASAGVQGLAVTGSAVFGGAVGATALEYVTVSGTTAINGGSVRTADHQTYGSPATLGADTTLTSTNTGLVRFAGALDGTTAGNESLAIVGNARFDAAVGATALEFVTVSGTTAINGGSVATAGIQTYTGQATLGADTTLTGSAITFGNTLNAASGGVQGLAVTGNAVFTGVVGGTALEYVTVSGTSAINGSSVDTTGIQTYTGPATLGADTALTGSTITFGNTLNAVAAGVQSLAVTGNAVFGGAVGTTALEFLTVSGTTGINGGSVATSGIQTYTGPATLGADTALTGTTITFGNTLNAALAGVQGLAVTGDAVFGGAVGGTALEYVTVSGTSAINGGSVATSGIQTYTGPTTLGAGTALTGGAITFVSTLDSAPATTRSLTVNGTASAVFGAPVGGSDNLASIGVTAPAISLFAVTTTGNQIYTGATTLNDGLTVVTAGEIHITGDTTLAQSLTLGTPGAGGDNITFTGRVNGTTSGAEVLTLNANTSAVATAGNVTVTGAIGDLVPLGGLDIDNGVAAPTANAVTLAAVTTRGGAVDIDARTNVQVNGAVQTSSPAGASGAVTATSAAGNVRFLGNIITAGGAEQNAASVDISAPGGSVVAQSIITNGGSTAIAGNYNAGNITIQCDDSVAVNPLRVDDFRPGGTVTLGSGAGSVYLIAMGTNAGASGVIAINAAGRTPTTDIPSVATIAANIGPADTLRIEGGAFVMGDHEKLTSLGSVLIKTDAGALGPLPGGMPAGLASGDAWISDINAGNVMQILTGNLHVLQHPGGAVVGSDGKMYSDDQVDYVARVVQIVAGSVTLENAAIFPAPPLPAPQIGSTILIAAPVEFAWVYVSPVPQLRGTPTELGLFLDAVPVPVAISNLATALASALPGQQVEVSLAQTVDASQQEDLVRHLGIYTRGPTVEELQDYLSGRKFYNDAPESNYPVSAGDFFGAAMSPSDNKVSIDRLPGDLASEALAKYRQVYWRQVEDPKTGNKIWKSVVGDLRKTIEKSVQEFKAKNNDKFDPVAYRTWAASTPDQKEANDLLTQLESLFRKIELLGLGPVEQSISLEMLARSVKPQGLSIQETISMILNVPVGASEPDQVESSWL